MKPSGSAIASPRASIATALLTEEKPNLKSSTASGYDKALLQNQLFGDAPLN